MTQPLSGIVARGGGESGEKALVFKTIKSVDDLDREVAAAKAAVSA